MKLIEKMKCFYLKKMDNGGFTLVELIVVIAILAILAGVAVPAYSGYVEKANKAADEQLLAQVNQAFTAACIENGTDNYNVANTAAGIPSFDVKTMTLNHAYQEEFEDYFENTSDSKFEVFKVILFKSELGMFTGVELSDAYNDLYEQLKTMHGEDIATLLASSFGQVGITELVDKVDVAAQWVSTMVDNPNFKALLYDMSNLNNIAKVLGFNSPTDEGFSESWESLIEQKQAQLDSDPANAGKDTYTMAMNQILANSAVLTAASNASTVSNEFMTNLGNGTAKDTILHNVNDANGDPATAVSQAAMAYGMYAAYLTHTGKEIPAEINLADVYSVLEDSGFQAYVNQDNGIQAQKDLDGYLAAMDMIATSSENKNASKDVLLNGFSNEQLIGVLQGVTNAD